MTDINRFEVAWKLRKLADEIERGDKKVLDINIEIGFSEIFDKYERRQIKNGLEYVSIVLGVVNND